MNCRTTIAASIALTVLAVGSTALAQPWIDPRCKELPLGKTLSSGSSGLDVLGPLVELGDGRLLTVEADAVRTSSDDGKTWSAPRKISVGPGPGIPSTDYCALLKTHSGALVLVYVDISTFKWAWDDAKNEAPKDVRADVWAIRSLDRGETWIDRQELLHGYCGALIGMIQTSAGQIVAPMQLMLDRNRHATFTCVSADDGKTWRRGNVIDLGGRGNHDGAIESTVAELSNGRLLMLMRTNLDRFWQAYSEDGGRYWRELRPSQIDASSAPGYMVRLASGRLALVWNRLYPEGKDSWFSRERRASWPADMNRLFPEGKDGFPRTPPGGDRSETAASWHRDELSLAFSEDDAKTWTKPVVVACKSRWHELSYPYLFERRPGELWIIVRDANRLAFSLKEADFVKK